MSIPAQDPPSEALIREHYDLLSVFYKWLWGQHIHHGYWEGNESRQEAQEKLVQKLVEFAEIQANTNVLDVGCGLGGTAIWLGRHHRSRVTGITISSVQRQLAACEAGRAGLADRVQFKCLDAARMTSLTERFGAIVCIECSEHFTNKRKFFQDCYHLITPGGRLAICAWCVGEHYAAATHSNLLNEVLHCMLLPSLASASDYQRWACDAGFADVLQKDVTSNVKATWDICDRIIHQPTISKLLCLTPPHVQEFAGSFKTMKEAFDSGAMSYVMLTARRP